MDVNHCYHKYHPLAFLFFMVVYFFLKMPKKPCFFFFSLPDPPDDDLLPLDADFPASSKAIS